MRAKARGPFNEFSGTGTFDLEEPSRSGLKVAIEAAVQNIMSQEASCPRISRRAGTGCSGAMWRL